jgi:hypothetical protein
LLSLVDRRKFPTTGTFSPVNRKLIGAALLATLTFAPAQTVFAHGGNGGSSSDYRIEVTRYEGDHDGVTVRPVELGNRMELVRTTSAEVQIIGYQGEPYIRLDNDGVFENVNSPAHYVNLDRFSRTPVPPTATPTAAPNWVKISDGNSVRWHDHRTHWMDPTPRQDVRDNPKVERLISADSVKLLVDGKPAAAVVTVTWLPPPSRMTWLVITTICACALLAALVLVPSLRALIPLFALIGAIACLVGSGGSTFRIVVSALAIVIAALGWALKNRWMPVVSSLVVVVLAITHFEVFEHQLLAGWAPAVLQRIAIGVALAFGAAVVGCELVVGLGSTPTVVEPEPEPAPVAVES